MVQWWWVRIQAISVFNLSMPYIFIEIKSWLPIIYLMVDHLNGRPWAPSRVDMCALQIFIIIIILLFSSTFLSTIPVSEKSYGESAYIEYPNGVSWPSGLAYRTQVLVLAAECGFESRPWHLCPWARHLTIIASLHPGVKWVPVRAELVD